MIKSILLVLNMLFLHTLLAQAVKVEVAKTPDGFTLLRAGQPYYIKGAGGHQHLNELIYLGGNSIRTWSHEDADEILANAQENGLTVMFGLWVQHERHGFNYNDEAAVKKQLDFFTEIVTKYKDHPAVLLWGIGNEVDLFYTNTKVWNAIQDIAAMVHRIDPNHPTTTVTAGLDSSEVFEVMTKAPDIDIFGINTYGDIGKVPNNIRKFGWQGPYIISEWGPNGHWEVAKTKWGAPIEQTSTEKAASYASRYEKYIAADASHCLGSYVFLWGQKQETTSTWYGLFTAKGNATEPLDKLYIAWQNKTPPNSAPSVKDLMLDDKPAAASIYLKSGNNYNATISVTDADGDNLKVEWFVYPESGAQSAGGDFESALQPVLGVLHKRENTSVEMTAPETEGAYRLFVFVTDNDKRTAYANIPFYVMPRTASDPPVKPIRFKKQVLNVNR